MKLKYKMEVLEMDGTPMAIPVDCDEEEFRGMLRMNGTAADILKLLENEITEEEIITALKKEYGVPAEQIRSGVQKIIGMLREKGFITGE